MLEPRIEAEIRSRKPKIHKELMIDLIDAVMEIWEIDIWLLYRFKQHKCDEY